MTFKVLHCLLVFLRRSFCLEGAEISSLTRLRIFLAGIQPVLARFQFSDHEHFSEARRFQLQRSRQTNGTKLSYSSRRSLGSLLVFISNGNFINRSAVNVISLFRRATFERCQCFRCLL